MKITRISEALGKIDDEISREAVEQFEQKSIQISDAPAEKPRVIYEHKTKKAPIIIAAASICAAAAIAVPTVNHFRTANLILESTGAADSKIIENISSPAEDDSIAAYKEFFRKTSINKDGIYDNFSDFIVPLNKTASKNGTTLTIHDMFKCNDWIVFRMSCDTDGIDMSQFKEYYLCSSDCVSSSVPIGENTFVGIHADEYNGTSDNVSVKFDAIELFNDNEKPTMYVIEDGIEFEIPVNSNNIAPTIEKDIDENVGNDEVRFTGVSLSPYNCDLKFDGEFVFDGQENFDIRIYMKDGSEILLGQTNWTLIQELNTFSMYFYEKIDPSDVYCMSIDIYSDDHNDIHDIFVVSEEIPTDIKTACIVDYVKDRHFVYDDERAFTLPEYEDVKFKWVKGRVFADDEVIIGPSFAYADSVYLTDLNGDGKREIIFGALRGSDISASRVYVYDHSAKKAYALEFKGNDHTLFVKDDELWVRESANEFFENIPQEFGEKKLVLSDLLQDSETDAITAKVERLKISENDGEFVVEDSPNDANVNLVTVKYDKSKSNYFAIIVNRDGSYELYTSKIDEEELRQITEKTNSVAYVWTFPVEGGWGEQIIGAEGGKDSWMGSLPDKEDGDIVTSYFWYSLNSDISDYVTDAEANSFIITENGDGTYSAELEFSQY